MNHRLINSPKKRKTALPALSIFWQRALVLAFIYASSTSKMLAQNIAPAIHHTNAPSVCLGENISIFTNSSTAAVNWAKVGQPTVHTIPTSGAGSSNVYSATTFAGYAGYLGSGGDTLAFPQKVFRDAAGNIYVTDAGNKRVQKWTADGAGPFTVAGGNGAGSAANQLHSPRGLFVDATGDIYVSDAGNNRVQKWAPGATAGVIVAGGNGAGSAANQLHSPRGLFVDAAGNVYVSDNFNQRVQKWAPGATAGVTVANQLSNPKGLFVDAVGNIYIADGLHIQKWAPNAAAGVTVAGGGNNPDDLLATDEFNANDVFADAGGNLFIADDNNRLLYWPACATTGTVLVGKIGKIDGVDQYVPGYSSEHLSQPGGIFVDFVGGKIYVADTYVHRIQTYEIYNNEAVFTPTEMGTYVFTPAANGCAADAISQTVVVNGLTPSLTMTTAATCNTPAVISASGGVEYDFGSGFSTFNQYTLGTEAGTYYVVAKSDLGCTATASLAMPIVKGPQAIGEMYHTDFCLGDTVSLQVSPNTTEVEWKLNGNTVAVNTVFSNPTPHEDLLTQLFGSDSPNSLKDASDIFVDEDGNIFIADEGNHRILKWTPGTGLAVTIAGGNGPGAAANQFDRPSAMQFDAAGNLYVLDRNNHRVQKWPPGATVGQTVAGGNGQGSAANQLDSPEGFYLDAAGNFFISDTENHRVQKWPPGAIQGSTVAGGNGNGTALNQIAYPRGIVQNAEGYLLISSVKSVIKWFPGTSSGSTLVGPRSTKHPFFKNLPNNQMDFVSDIWLDKKGNLYVADGNNRKVLRFEPGAQEATVVFQSNGNLTNVFSANFAVCTDSLENLYIVYSVYLDASPDATNWHVALKEHLPKKVSTFVPGSLISGNLTAVVKNSACSASVSSPFSMQVADAGLTVSTPATCENRTATLTATGGTLFNFSDGLGFTASNTRNVAASGNYTVLVKNNNGGCRDLATAAVNIPPVVAMPAAFLQGNRTTSTLALTGFNQDVIAEQSDSHPNLSTTATVTDAFSSYFLTENFYFNGVTAYSFLNPSGAVVGATKYAMPYQLQSYSANNALKLTTDAPSGMLTLTNPIKADSLFVLATSENTSVVDITIEFTDNTTQIFNDINIQDYFYNINYALQRVGYFEIDEIWTTSNGPFLHEIALPIADISKTISKVSFLKKNQNTTAHIFAMSTLTKQIAQTLCTGATVANLIANIRGAVVKCYDSPTAQTPLSAQDLVTDNTIYYISQEIEGCQGPRLRVLVSIVAGTPVSVSSPTSNSPICGNGNLTLNISASGGEPIQFAWEGAGTFSDKNIANPSVANPKTGNYTAIVSNVCGTVATDLEVSVAPLPAAPTTSDGGFHKPMALSLTGFTQDVVAEGVGPAVAYTTDNVGAGLAYFLSSTYRIGTNTSSPSSYLPNGGTFTSNSVPYQLQPYTANNSLVLHENGSMGILQLAAPKKSEKIYIIATSADGASTVDVTAQFTDGTSEVFSNQTIADWFGSGSFAIRGIGRIFNGQIQSGNFNPRLYAIELTVSDASKILNSVKFEKTSTAGKAHIMAISAKPREITRSVCAGATLDFLSGIVGENIKWYAAFSGGTDLPNSTVLADNTYYFASQTINGCESTERLPVRVFIDAAQAQPMITALTANNNPICVGTTLNLQATATGFAPLSYVWSGAGVFSNETTASPSVENVETGIYSLTVSNACGSTSSAISISVNQNVGTPTFLNPVTKICPGETAVYNAAAADANSIVYSILNNTGASVDANSGAVSNIVEPFTIVATASGCGPTASASQAVTISNATPVVYVNASVAGGTGDGTSWANAFSSLSDALAAAHVCSIMDTIKVAAGIYKPTKKPFHSTGEMTTADARDVTFHVHSGLVLQGGYNAETGQRNVAANPTILSGDIAGNDNFNIENGGFQGTTGDENAYHVVMASVSSGAVGLDGFSITGGHANGTQYHVVNGVSIYQDYGSGIYIENGANAFNNNTIYNNACRTGGAIYIGRGTNDVSKNSIFNNLVNGPDGYGGGIFTFYGTNSISNNTVFNNSVNTTNTAQGGGIYTEYGTNKITSNTIYGNSVNGNNTNGGGLFTYWGTNTMTNNIFWNNKNGTLHQITGADYARGGFFNSNTFNNNFLQLSEGSYSGSNSLGTADNNFFETDPLFVNANNPAGPNGLHRTADDGLALQINSPARDAGTAPDPTLPTDILGNGRAAAYDIGAYEVQCFTTEICNGTDDDCNGTIDDVAVTCTPGTRTWTGAVSTDWATPCNWSPACLPTAADDVVIASTALQPSIGAGTAAAAKSVLVNSGAVLHVAASGSLVVHGFTNFSGSSTAFGNSGTFNNSGTLTINATATTGQIGIFNNSIINNNACAIISSTAPLANQSAASISNHGLFSWHTNLAHTNSGTIINHGVLQFTASQITNNITNNEIIVAPKSGNGNISPTLALAAPFDFSIGTTWFLDENLTQPAGNFNPTTNTFSNVALQNGVPTTVYFSINDAAGGCSRTVSMPITWGNACTPTTEICNGLDDDCDNQIDENNNLAANFNAIHVTCFGGSNGTIFTSPTGGTAPLTFNWSNGKTTQNINLLPFGHYILTISDHAGCSKIFAPVPIAQPADLEMSVVTTPTTATITSSGGTGAHSYNRTGALTFQPNAVFTGLLPGATYIFKTKDANGCQKSLIKKLPTSLAGSGATVRFDHGRELTEAEAWLADAVVIERFEREILEKNGKENALVVFPNPAANLLTISNLSENRPAGLQIFNAFGEAVFSLQNAQATEILDVSNWPPGSYFIFLRNEREEPASAKFLKID